MLLSACGGGESQPTTAQAPQAKQITDPGSTASERDEAANAAGPGNGQRPGHDGDGRRPDGAPGPETGGDGERDGSRNDRPSSGSGKTKPGDSGERSQTSAAEEELESNVQELLEDSQGARPDDETGLQLPPGFSDQGGKPSDPLRQACEALGSCSGSDGRD